MEGGVLPTKESTKLASFGLRIHLPTGGAMVDRRISLPGDRTGSLGGSWLRLKLWGLITTVQHYSVWAFTPLSRLVPSLNCPPALVRSSLSPPRRAHVGASAVGRGERGTSPSGLFRRHCFRRPRCPPKVPLSSLRNSKLSTPLGRGLLGASVLPP